MQGKTLVAGVLLDIHGVGIKILKGVLERQGFKVVYVGARLIQEDFIGAAIESNAAAILVSTSTGHAEIECKGMREKCVEAGLEDILLYLGGNLLPDGAQQEKREDAEKKFKDMGFSRVYWPDSSIDQIVADLKSDTRM